MILRFWILIWAGNKWNWLARKLRAESKYCLDYLHYKFHSAISKFRWSSLSLLAAKQISLLNPIPTLIQLSKKYFRRKRLVTISINSVSIDVPVNDILYLGISSKNHCYALVGRKTPSIPIYGNITELSEKNRATRFPSYFKETSL